MEMLRLPLVWFCTLIVALPLSPCAFFASACSPVAAEADRDVQPDVAPCCAEHAPRQSSPMEQRDSHPCERQCCQLSPFVPPAEKVLASAPLLLMATALADFVVSPASPLAAASAPLAETVPIQILHCQWRC